MDKTPLFYGTVRDGRLKLEHADDFRLCLTKLEGKEITVCLKKVEYIRTLPENRYYWGVIVRMVADEMAILPDEAHDFLKSLFLKEGVEVNGKRWEVVKSTASLTIGEFEDYCEKARQWAANELNCPIPLPNEIIERDF